MPRLSFFKKLFESKCSRGTGSEFPVNKHLDPPTLSKFKTSTRARYSTLKAAFRTSGAKIPGHVREDVSEDEMDISQCLPAVDDIGSNLGLNFDQQDPEDDQSPSTPEEAGKVGPSSIDNADVASRIVPQADGHISGNIHPVIIDPDLRDSPRVAPQAQPSSSLPFHGTRRAWVVTVPRPPSLEKLWKMETRRMPRIVPRRICCLQTSSSIHQAPSPPVVALAAPC
jgi:hypothetical protein